MTSGVFAATALVLLCLVFLSVRSFREAVLSAIHRYDASSSRHQKTIQHVVIGIGAVYLAYLRYVQSQTLNTSVYDHGMFVNILWNSAHGRPYWDSFREMNFLGDHFSPFLFLLAVPYFFAKPLSWPLFAQTAAMVIAVLLVLQIATSIHPLRPFERLLLVPFFLINAYFQRIHRYDMHPIAFAMPVVVAIYLFAKQDSKWVYVLLPVALFGIQEDVSLMILGFSTYMIMFSSKRARWIVISLISVCAFYVNFAILVPHFLKHQSAYLARYSVLGSNLKELIYTSVSKPWIPIGTFFSYSHLRGVLGVLASFGFLPLFRPISLAMIPPALQHGLSDFAGQYKFQMHYSSNLMPVLMIGMTASLAARKLSYQKLIPFFLLLAAYSAFQNKPYIKMADGPTIDQVRKLAADSDENEVLSVQGAIGVPFSCRRKIRQFPDFRGASRIILAPAYRTWPLEKSEFMIRVQKLQRSPRWIQRKEEPLLVFERR